MVMWCSTPQCPEEAPDLLASFVKEMFTRRSITVDEKDGILVVCLADVIDAWCEV